MEAGAFQLPKTGDRLATLDLSAAKIENARHQPPHILDVVLWRSYAVHGELFRIGAHDYFAPWLPFLDRLVPDHRMLGRWRQAVLRYSAFRERPLSVNGRRWLNND